MEDSDQVDPQGLSDIDRTGHFAIYAPPELSGVAVPDHAEQATSVLVHPSATVLFLRVSSCGRAGHDDFRIDAECQGFGTASRIVGAGSVGRSVARRPVGERAAPV